MPNADRTLELILATAVATGIMQSDSDDTDPFVIDHTEGDPQGYPLVYVRHLSTDRRFVITIAAITEGLSNG